MNIDYNIETFVLLGGSVMSLFLSLLIMKSNWKQYGLLFISTAIIGEVLDIMFIKLGFYHYPYKILPGLTVMPFTLVMTLFPFYVVFGVRYSPVSWSYKFVFYMIMIHIGVTAEVLCEVITDVIEYGRFWDTWDSYIWWWLFLLGFELIGGLLVSKEYRKPISEDFFKYKSIGWYLSHFIFVLTIFLGGLYLGTLL